MLAIPFATDTAATSLSTKSAALSTSICIPPLIIAISSSVVVVLVPLYVVRIALRVLTVLTVPVVLVSEKLLTVVVMPVTVMVLVSVVLLCVRVLVSVVLLIVVLLVSEALDGVVREKLVIEKVLVTVAELVSVVVRTVVVLLLLLEALVVGIVIVPLVVVVVGVNTTTSTIMGSRVCTVIPLLSPAEVMLALMTLLSTEGSAVDNELVTLLMLRGLAPREAAPAVASCGRLMVKSTCTPVPFDKRREDIHAIRLPETKDKVTLM
jgi:hypothetical protein